eukprot:3262188-Pleurochrysis_carterae.AAC.1
MSKCAYACVCAAGAAPMQAPSRAARPRTISATSPSLGSASEWSWVRPQHAAAQRAARRGQGVFGKQPGGDGVIWEACSDESSVEMRIPTSYGRWCHLLGNLSSVEVPNTNKSGSRVGQLIPPVLGIWDIVLGVSPVRASGELGARASSS